MFHFIEKRESGRFYETRFTYPFGYDVLSNKIINTLKCFFFFLGIKGS